MNGKLDEVKGENEVEWSAGEASEALTHDDEPNRDRRTGQAPCRSSGKVNPIVERFVDDG